MERHVANAQAVATWLGSRDEVASVSYAGLPSSPWYQAARKYAPAGPGAVLAFETWGRLSPPRDNAVLVQRNDSRSWRPARKPPSTRSPGAHRSSQRSGPMPVPDPASCPDPVTCSQVQVTFWPTLRVHHFDQWC
jgi:hypothetical protein